MASKEQGRGLSLTDASKAYLLEQLGELSRSGGQWRRRWETRMAMTFRPGKKGRDGIPEGPIALEDFKLLAIGYGRRAGVRLAGPSQRS